MAFDMQRMGVPKSGSRQISREWDLCAAEYEGVDVCALTTKGAKFEL